MKTHNIAYAMFQRQPIYTIDIVYWGVFFEQLKRVNGDVYTWEE